MDCPGCTTLACLVFVTSILQIIAENVFLWLKNHCFGANTPCIRCGERPRKKQSFKKLEDGSKCYLNIPEFDPFFRSKSQIVAKFRSWLLIAQGNSAVDENESNSCDSNDITEGPVDMDSDDLSDDSDPEAPSTRLGRAMSEHIRLKRRYGMTEMGNYKYMIQGSTDRHYTIYMYIGTGGTECTCPDGRRGNRCKHVYFVLMKKLLVNEDHPVFSKSEFTRGDLRGLR